MADESVIEQRPDGAELLVARHLGIDAVELPETDLLHAEKALTHQCLLAQIFGAPHRVPGARTCADEAALGSDEHAFIGVKRFLQIVLGNIGAVGIGRIDEVYAEFRDTAEGAQAFFAICRLAPDALARNAHGAKAQPVYGDVPAYLK